MPEPVPLGKIVCHLDTRLRIEEIPDYPGALNGLQLENRDGEVTRVAASVDAHLPVIEKAVAAGADLLVVHHGMFWGGPHGLTGAQFAKFSQAIDRGLAIYSVHLPLDMHPELGNNALLAKALGLEVTGEFGDFNGVAIGVRGRWNRGNRSALKNALESATGHGAHLCPGGPETPEKIGLITGGGGDHVAEAKAAGLDTLVTGEGPHHTFTLGEELGINVLYGGHYATETFGVKAVAAELENEFGLPWEFIDHPTGL